MFVVFAVVFLRREENVSATLLVFFLVKELIIAFDADIYNDDKEPLLLVLFFKRLGDMLLY